MNIELHPLIRSDILGKVLAKGPGYEVCRAGASINYRKIDSFNWKEVENYVKSLCRCREDIIEYAKQFHMDEYIRHYMRDLNNKFKGLLG
jgi:tRNA U55 pseudouridine synthase TruB